MRPTEGEQDSARRSGADGFSLIELLVVIVILGILGAVVVFSVGAVGDRGQATACKVDEKTLRTAEATAFADAREKTGTGAYSTEQQLVDDNLLNDPSSLHNVIGYQDAAKATPLATPTPATPWAAIDVTITEKGKACVPEDASPTTECPPGVPIADGKVDTGAIVKKCTQPNGAGTDDDVPYPF